LPATEAAQAHQIGTAEGLRGKLVLTFSTSPDSGR